MPSAELGVCKENLVISLKHRTPGRLLLNVPVSEEFCKKPGSFTDLPCPGSHQCQKRSPTPLLCFSPLPLSCGVSAQLPAFCWPDHPLANPAENCSAQCVPEMAKRSREHTAGKDGARETSPFPGQHEDRGVHLYPMPADRVSNSSRLGSPTPTHTELSESVMDLWRRRGTSTDDRRLESKASWICRHFTWFQAFKVQGYSLPASHVKQCVLTHLAALRMMKNLGVKRHASLLERNTCSGVSLNFKQVFSVSAGLSPAVLP